MTIQPWLKAMENGGLGEARARAFLLERFWVLERSVDIEGADFLIQQRLTGRNFLDPKPPRLGIVQVKFVQDGNTTISLKKQYVCGSNGEPFAEFFLLIFSGKDDSDQTFMLSAVDIIRDFNEKFVGDHSVLSVASAKILNNNYAVLSKRHALNQIDLALKNADFMANRMFLSLNTPIRLESGQINSELTLPLYNSYGDIVETFFEEKEKLRKTIYEVEDVLNAMYEMLATVDPVEAFKSYNEVLDQHIGRKELQFRVDFFNDESFLGGVLEHKNRLVRLREMGILSSYVALIENYKRILMERLIEIGEKDSHVLVEVNYHPTNCLYPVIKVIEIDRPHIDNEIAIPGRISFQLSLRSAFSAYSRNINKNNKTEILTKNMPQLVGRFQLILDPFVFGKDSF